MKVATRETDRVNPRSNWWLVLLVGIATIILGFLLVVNPASTVPVLVRFLGFYWLVTGVIHLISLIWDRSLWGWKLFTGILGIIAGLFIVRNPIISTLLVPASFALWLGILGLFIGFSELFHAFRGGGWGMGLLGVLSIIAGFLLITRPVAAGFALPLVLGVFFIVDGILAIISAFMLRRTSVDYEAQTPQSSMAAEAIPSTGTGADDMLRTTTTGMTGERPDTGSMANQGGAQVIGKSAEEVENSDEDPMDQGKRM